jgi:hypothetical protein
MRPGGAPARLLIASDIGCLALAVGADAIADATIRGGFAAAYAMGSEIEHFFQKANEQA